MGSKSRFVIGFVGISLVVVLLAGLLVISGLAAETGAEMTYLPLILRAEMPTVIPTVQPGPDWLVYVNQFRILANLPQLTENVTWSAGGVLHSRYMVKEDEITHYESASSLWYTQEGYDAGRNGNVAVSSSTSYPDESAIDLWMTGPFHAVGILDPQLVQTGFGSYRENSGTWKTGATLDVLRGLGSLPSGINFPIYFPKSGGQTWLTSFGGYESPDPLTSCPGYSAPTGSPVILQLGSGSVTPNVTFSSFRQGNTNLEHCVFDETNYVNSNSVSQSLGRNVLNSRDAIVMMPRNPLVVGQTYIVTITANGQTYTWSFLVINAGTSTNQTSDAWQTK
jgi:hypothetical protein